MDLIGNENITQALEDLQTYPEYRKVLSVLLKNEIYMLLQRLSEAGEESIVMTASVSDGSMSVIGSNFGEKFVLEPGNAVNLVTGFKEQFARFCHDTTVSAPKRARRYSYQHYQSTPSTNYAGNESTATTHAVIKSRLKETCQKNIQTNIYEEDNSDKAIDETVSRLVKNIFKESQERERELSEGGSRGRRRRRRRTYGDHYHVQNRRSYRHQSSYKPREVRIAQFFPTIPQKKNENSVDSVNENGEKQEWFAGDIEIKREPEDCFFSGGYCQSDSYDNQQDKKPRIDELYPCETVEKGVDKSIEKIIEMETRDTVENGVDKSIQKIIEMETGDRPSDSNDLDEDTYKMDSLHQQTECDEKDIEEKVKDIVEKITKDCEKIKENSEYHSRESEEIMTDETDTNVNDSEHTEDGENLKQDEVDEEVKEEQFEQIDKSMEEFSADDGIEELGSKKKLRRSFIHKGYSYIRDKAGKGNTVYWKCGRIGCKGRVIQRGGEKIRTQNHNHNPIIEFENGKPPEFESS